MSRAEKIGDVERRVLIDNRVGMIVKLDDSQALVTFARVGVTVLVCQPQVTAASVELCVDLLIRGGDRNCVGKLPIGEATAEHDACAVE